MSIDLSVKGLLVKQDRGVLVGGSQNARHSGWASVQTIFSIDSAVMEKSWEWDML